jgi:hypothetical protein
MLVPLDPVARCELAQGDLLMYRSGRPVEHRQTLDR